MRNTTRNHSSSGSRRLRKWMVRSMVGTPKRSLGAAEHRWYPCVRQRGEQDVIRRAGLGQADPAAGLGAVTTRERHRADGPAGLVALPHRDLERRLEGEALERLGRRHVRRGRLLELRGHHRHAEDGLRQRQQPFALLQAAGHEAELAPRPLDRRPHGDRAFVRRGEVVHGERAGCALRIVDGRREGAQDDRGDVAAVRPALDPPPPVHARVEATVARRDDGRVEIEAGRVLGGHGRAT